MLRQFNKGLTLAFTVITITISSLLIGCTKESSKNEEQVTENSVVSVKKASQSEITIFSKSFVDYYSLISSIDQTISFTNLDFGATEFCSRINGNSSALLLNLKSQNNGTRYALLLPKDGDNYGSSFLLSITKDKEIKYYDLKNSIVHNVTFLSNSIQISKSTLDAELMIKSNGTNSIGLLSNRCSWQGVNDCIKDAYDNHGALSTWLFIQSAFLPQTAAVIAAACLMTNVKCA